MVFANFIHSKEIMFKHAKGMRDIYGLEIHPFHEMFLFLDGDADFISETSREKLAKNTLVIIPKENFHHFVVNCAEEDYQRYVLNFGEIAEFSDLIDEKIQKVCTVKASEEICALFSKLAKCATAEDSYKKELLLKAVFCEILLETELDIEKEAPQNLLHINPIVKSSLKYIDKNLKGISSIKDVAIGISVSESHLAHLFKKELHISPHKYILEKRLIKANRLIESGMGPVAASEECGFLNYSGFYKMYKKAFGHPPSKAKKK